MSLVKYKEKRNFKETTEPVGGGSRHKQLVFVIQKHDATRLHYDFRLEMDGVLKSWAVPKGPSTDPATKRLAMQVEDHPFDYKDFEGIIPEGNYGAGTVIIWDQGTYEPLENIDGKKAQEKHLLRQLKDGSIKIILHGKKLKGEWALVHTKQSENSWLLIKHRDKYAAETDITEKGKSVVSGKTLEQLEKTNHSTKTSGNGETKKIAVKKTTASKKAVSKSTASKTVTAESRKKKAQS